MTYDGEVLERPGLLNVLQSLGQVLELGIYLDLGLLCALDGLSLESVNGLELPVDIVLLRGEGVELLLDLVNDGRVLENGAVVGEVDGARVLAQLLDLAAGVIVALLEGDQRVGRAAFEAELGTNLGPVDFEGCAAL